MLFLHLSDIHFREFEFGSAQDPHYGTRRRMVEDIDAQFQKFGEAPDRILISGDIAFSGQKQEYDFAREWLDELCDSIGIPHDAVVLVPGNHDVDQRVSESIVVRGLRRQLIDADETERKKLLIEALRETEARSVLYSPIDAYNVFAGRYSCILAPPDETVLRQKFDLGNGWILQILGINSALISSKGDEERGLLVDTASHNIISERGVVNLVMCHHPTNWLADGAVLQRTIDSAAPIQLFGHEHVAEPVIGDRHLRLHAGATNPALGEGAYEPGYNILRVAVEQSDHEAWELRIKTWPRKWQPVPPRFVAIRGEGERDVFEKTIRLAQAPTADKRRMAAEQVIVQGAASPAPEEDSKMPSGSPPPPSMRSLTLRFFDLTYSQQSAIIAELGITDEADADAIAAIRFRNALRRVKERAIEQALSDAIGRYEGGAQ